MRVLERDIALKEAISNKNNFQHCQASFNSDNCIVLRNYNRNNLHNDEIIVLSPAETAAVFCLFSRIGEKNRQHTLPF